MTISWLDSFFDTRNKNSYVLLFAWFGNLSVWEVYFRSEETEWGK